MDLGIPYGLWPYFFSETIPFIDLPFIPLIIYSIRIPFIFYNRPIKKNDSSQLAATKSHQSQAFKLLLLPPSLLNARYAFGTTAWKHGQRGQCETPGEDAVIYGNFVVYSLYSHSSGKTYGHVYIIQTTHGISIVIYAWNMEHGTRSHCPYRYMMS